MFVRSLVRAQSSSSPALCLLCRAKNPAIPSRARLFHSTGAVARTDHGSAEEPHHLSPPEIAEPKADSQGKREASETSEEKEAQATGGESGEGGEGSSPPKKSKKKEKSTKKEKGKATKDKHQEKDQAPPSESVEEGTKSNSETTSPVGFTIRKHNSTPRRSKRVELRRAGKNGSATTDTKPRRAKSKKSEKGEDEAPTKRSKKSKSPSLDVENEASEFVQAYLEHIRKRRGAPDGDDLVRKILVRPHEEVIAESKGMSLREAMSGGMAKTLASKKAQSAEEKTTAKPLKEALTKQRPKPITSRYPWNQAAEIENVSAEGLEFTPIPVSIPPVPMLAHELDRVLFNPGIYRLQDPRSRVYNFDPYLEKIMPAKEFDFNVISAYQTSSKDPTLLAMAREQGTKFCGSTSSMSQSLVQFHYLLSQWRKLRVDRLSKGFPAVSEDFTKIQKGPSAMFLRYKDGVYAIDADKEFDSPNIMSWLGNSLELLLTNTAEDFERYRRTSKEAPSENDSGRCYHYSKQGNVLMRSQLDAHDPRLPGTGIFDLKTRAVVSIRMNSSEYEEGIGYQLHYDHGEWESFEREYFDMMRATMLKYSLQVRMGRMDGIFIAFHNIERIFGFQYVPLEDMDYVLHGQSDRCLGDQEFKLSVQLMSELMEKATQEFPETTIRFHFETREGDVPFMYVFAEPVTEEQADAIQDKNKEEILEFERTVIGIDRNDPRSQAEWQDLQNRVEEEIEDDEETEAESTKGVDSAADESSKDENHDQLQMSTDELDENDQELEQEVPVSEVDGQQPATSIEDSNESNEAEVDEDAASFQDEGEAEEAFKEAAPEPKPLMGWAVAIRNRLNGSYVVRPTNIEADDKWEVEYKITEIPPTKRHNAYESVKKRREKILSFEKKEKHEGWKLFTDKIRRYTLKGRDWRETQDSIDKQMGRRVFRPMGPGSRPPTSDGE